MQKIDVWMQHPTRRFLEQPFFESLRRWARQDAIPEIPLSATITTMDEAQVEVGLLTAWWGPHGALIDNDEVASFIHEYPERFRGLASVNLARPMEAVRERVLRIAARVVVHARGAVVVIAQAHAALWDRLCRALARLRFAAVVT